MSDPAAPTHGSQAIVNPLESLLGYQIRRASGWILSDLGNGLEELSLRPTEASILMLVEANPGISQSDIGRVFSIKRANMTPLASSLSERGFIERLPADGRSNALRLTEAGERMMAEIWKRVNRHEGGFLTHLSAAERADLTRLIARIWGG